MIFENNVAGLLCLGRRASLLLWLKHQNGRCWHQMYKIRLLPTKGKTCGAIFDRKYKQYDFILSSMWPKAILVYIIWLQLYQRTLKCEQRNKLFGLWYMVFNTTFKNISDISRRSVLLVEETGENRRSVTSHWQTLSHNIVSCRLPWTGLELTTLVMTGTDCTGTCKSNYHAITTTTAPQRTKTNGKLHQLKKEINLFFL